VLFGKRGAGAAASSFLRGGCLSTDGAKQQPRTARSRKAAARTRAPSPPSTPLVYSSPARSLATLLSACRVPAPADDVIDLTGSSAASTPLAVGPVTPRASRSPVGGGLSKWALSAQRTCHAAFTGRAPYYRRLLPELEVHGTGTGDRVPGGWEEPACRQLNVQLQLQSAQLGDRMKSCMLRPHEVRAAWRPHEVEQRTAVRVMFF